MGSGEMRAAGLQQRTIAAYMAMCGFGESWAHRLVMLGAADEAAPQALAAMAAGGAVLWVCDAESALRESSLLGLTDFQVTSLGEALRILKNEIRKGQPVGVGVLDGAGEVWREAVQRGVQPDAVFAEARNIAAATLVKRGARELREEQSLVDLEVNVARGWRERRAEDARMLAAAEQLEIPQREAALRWLGAAPRLFPRDLERWVAAGWREHRTERDCDGE